MIRFLIVLAAAFSACASPVTDDARPFESEAEYGMQRAAAVATLDVAIGEPQADRLSACRAVPVGEQACGGPISFSVYSTDTSDPARVESAAERVTALDRRANAQFGFVSTCALLSAPPLAVEDGVCIASL